MPSLLVYCIRKRCVSVKQHPGVHCTFSVLLRELYVSLKPGMGGPSSAITVSDLRPGMGGPSSAITVSDLRPGMGGPSSAITVSDLRPGKGGPSSAITVSDLRPGMGGSQFCHHCFWFTFFAHVLRI
jgi:uridine phosphorylase